MNCEHCEKKISCYKIILKALELDGKDSRCKNCDNSFDFGLSLKEKSILFVLIMLEINLLWKYLPVQSGYKAVIVFLILLGTLFGLVCFFKRKP